jgi:hypothetical protein
LNLFDFNHLLLVTTNLSMEVENTNQVVINFHTYVSLSELETQCEESNSFLSLCKFLKSKTYTVIPLYVFNDLLELKRNNRDMKFCIRDSSDKSSREQGRRMNTFEVC